MRLQHKAFWTLVAISVVSLFGCVSALGADPGEIVVAQAGFGSHMDPHRGWGDNPHILQSLYDGLTRIDAKGNLQPGLAESWEYNADLTEFTLTLRPDVTFHDGAKLDSAAVARNFERSAALGTRAGFATSETMSHVAAVELPVFDAAELVTWFYRGIAGTTRRYGRHDLW